MGLTIRTETDKKALRDFLGEMSASMARAEGEREFQREAIKDFAEKYTMDKKVLRKLAKTYHQSNFHTHKQEFEEFAELFEEVVLGGKADE